MNYLALFTEINLRINLFASKAKEIVYFIDYFEDLV